MIRRHSGSWRGISVRSQSEVELLSIDERQFEQTSYNARSTFFRVISNYLKYLKKFDLPNLSCLESDTKPDSILSTGPTTT